MNYYKNDIDFLHFYSFSSHPQNNIIKNQLGGNKCSDHDKEFDVDTTLDKNKMIVTLSDKTNQKIANIIFTKSALKGEFNEWLIQPPPTGFIEIILKNALLVVARISVEDKIQYII
jgi:hypothetical protein